MDFKTLEMFVWIARLGSFRAAAQRLYTTQPAVSARIANLERNLGVALFDRSGRNAVLTVKGRDLVAYAERILSLRGEMLNAVGDASALQGSIRLGVAETIVYTWLPRLIELLNEAYPAVVLELDVDISRNLADKLARHALDIAFLMGPLSQPDTARHALSSYRLSWVASPHMALPDAPVALRDLARIPIITYPRQSQPYVAINRLLKTTGERIRIHASSSLATIVRMTVDGIGVSALPTEIIQRELKAGDLKIFSAEGELPKLDFMIAYGTDPESPVTRAVGKLALSIAGSEY